MKKLNLRRVLALTMTAVMTFTLLACGATNDAIVDDQAAVRGMDEGAGEIWIDDEAIALAGSAASSQAALDACTAYTKKVNVIKIYDTINLKLFNEQNKDL